MRRFVCRVTGTLAVLGLMAAAGCGDDKKGNTGGGGTGGPSGEIEIGTVIAITGALAPYGPAINQAIVLAADEINTAGGVLGKKLKIVNKDDGTMADKAGMVAQDLVNEGAVAIIGGLASGASLKIRDVTMARNIPQISPASTSPALTGVDNFFRTVPSDAIQGAVLAKQAKMAGLAKVTVIHEDNSYGQGLAKAFEDAFKAGGGMVPANAEYNAMQPSFTAQVTMALAGSPDGVLLIAYPAEGVKIMQEAKARGAMAGRPRWLFPDGLKDQMGFVDNLNVAKPLAEGAIGTAPGASSEADDVARANKFKAAFKAKYGAEAGTYCDSAYDAVYLLAAAMQKAGNTTDFGAQIIAVSKGGTGATEFAPGEWAAAKAAIDMMGTVNYQGASGKLDFDSNGEPPGFDSMNRPQSFYAIWTVTNGKIVDMSTVGP